MSSIRASLETIAHHIATAHEAGHPLDVDARMELSGAIDDLADVLESIEKAVHHPEPTVGNEIV